MPNVPSPKPFLIAAATATVPTALLLALLVAHIAGGTGATTATKPAAPSVTDSLAQVAAGAKATALIFVSPACPISNSYAPEIRAISNTYKARGARVTLVYAGAGVTAAEAAKHAASYNLSSLPRLIDPTLAFADKIGATTTPEVFVLDTSGKVAYSGRIDDAYADRGKARTTGAANHDLRTALDAVLAGRRVSNPHTRAVGCVLERGDVPLAQSTPTYSRDIAPILNANCVSCHRAGEIGPMPLDGYENARRYAENIALATGERRMPPWKPVDDHDQFVGARRLTDAQTAVLKTWASAGAPAGDLKKAPPAPSFPTGWRLGTPDLVLKMPEEWTVPASGKDLYRCFVIPSGVTEDRQVVAVEYRAGNKSVVHHILAFLDTSGKAREKDAADPGAGYTSFGGPGFAPSGELGGWAPGNLPGFLPDGIARPLPKGSDVVLQIHYHPDGKVEKDQTQIGIYFARKPVTQQLRIFPLPAGFRSLDIPPGAKDFKVEQTFPVPLAADVISVTPHMHLLGKTFRMTAALPDGTTRDLIRIDDWDFNWQGTYQFKQAVHIPQGSRITLTATFDNSTDNPRNPNSPPKHVTWGEGTTDEMCIGFLGYTTAADADGSGARRLLQRLRERRSKAGAGIGQGR